MRKSMRVAALALGLVVVGQGAGLVIAGAGRAEAQPRRGTADRDGEGLRVEQDGAAAADGGDGAAGGVESAARAAAARAAGRNGTRGTAATRASGGAGTTGGGADGRGGGTGGAVSGSLRDLAARRGVRIGGAVQSSELTGDPAYASIVTNEFNVVTTENDLKFASVHPGPSTYNFAPADLIVGYAESHGSAVRGHNLVWYQSVPTWLQYGNYNRDQMIAILRDHIHTVVGRYRGRIAHWDVVNEAVVPGGLRSSIWLDRIGPDYIDMAFRFAREADPSVKLFYNDAGDEGLNPMSDAVYNLVRSMKARGVPIDGVGFESHFDTNPPSASEVLANMRRLKALGLEVAISELDVRLKLPASADALARQAQIYGSMMSVCLAAGNCRTFVTWGVTDRSTWVVATYPGYGAPLLFDEAGRPKPATAAVKTALAA